MAKKRKHAKPSRELLDPDDDSVPWESFEARRDEMFPAGTPPADFKFHGLPDEKRGDVWELVCNIAWYHIIGEYVDAQAATGAAISENLNILADDARGFANRIESLDVDTNNALLENWKPKDTNPVPNLRTELGGLIGSLRDFAERCDTTRAGRGKNRAHPETDTKRSTVEQLAFIWSGNCGQPTATQYGPFASFAEYVGKRLEFTPSHDMITRAVRGATIKGGVILPLLKINQIKGLSVLGVLDFHCVRPMSGQQNGDKRYGSQSAQRSPCQAGA